MVTVFSFGVYWGYACRRVLFDASLRVHYCIRTMTVFTYI